MRFMMFCINAKKRYLKTVLIFGTVQLLLYVNGIEKENGTIYVLLWPSANREPFNFLEMGKAVFFNRNCAFQNCFLTNETELFTNVTSFDVIVFNAQNLLGKQKTELTLPNARSSKQLYIFFSIEPAEVYPLSTDFDGFFNLTWTYRYDSNVTLQYIVVSERSGSIVGPQKTMHWMDIKKMDPLSKKIKKKIRKKKFAAAWFVSNCVNPRNNRQLFAETLKVELATLGLELHIYGGCGNFKCDKNLKDCGAIIRKQYYFYLAFENSFCEDYVSEKVLHGLQNFAIPVVYGGANYDG